MFHGKPSLPPPRLCHGTYRPEDDRKRPFYGNQFKTVTTPLTHNEMILACLKDHPKGVSLTDICEMTGIDRHRAHHLMTQLQKRGMAQREPITYRLGKNAKSE